MKREKCEQLTESSKSVEEETIFKHTISEFLQISLSSVVWIIASESQSSEVEWSKCHRHFFGVFSLEVEEKSLAKTYI